MKESPASNNCNIQLLKELLRLLPRRGRCGRSDKSDRLRLIFFASVFSFSFVAVCCNNKKYSFYALMFQWETFCKKTKGRINIKISLHLSQIPFDVRHGLQYQLRNDESFIITSSNFAKFKHVSHICNIFMWWVNNFSRRSADFML